ncbi:MAG: sulfatase-like hydrolase/transferase, partial [Proteobacteria bacterium]|nr:sulfatase-like hydrolase/transferase [Pseudomonadota bacterium]
MSIRSFLSKTLYRFIHRAIAFRDARYTIAKWYPTCFGKNFFYDPMFPKPDGQAYFAKYHGEKLDNPLTVNFKRFKTDIMQARRLKAGRHTVHVTTPSALPVALTGIGPHEATGLHAITVQTGERELSLGGLASDRYYYLPILVPGPVVLSADTDLIVANPLPLTQKKSHPVRMVMTIFIDNFGWDILDHLNWKKDLPNLSRFFASGMIFDQCYSSSNWTLAGVGSIVSGQSLSHHNMFHNDREDAFVGDGYKILPEYFQDDGYLTLQVCGNVRKSPGYGYVKGYDRTVYRNDIPLGESLEAIYDHVRAFPERDHFVWLTVMDAHHTLAAVPDITNQLQVPLETHDYTKRKGKSPRVLGADARSVARYIQELKRVDFYLGQLFAFLEERFKSDEMLVALVSDHGPGFLSDSPGLLSQQKTHVPFILRGRDIPAGRTDEFLQAADILPTLLAANGWKSANEIDGRLAEALGGPKGRDFVLSEIKISGQPYLATIKDWTFEFNLESVIPVDDDGRINLTGAKAELLQRG